MTNLHMIQGDPVTLTEILDAREQRQMIQQQLLDQYHLPLISFTLNIAGPVKVFPLAVKAYEEGLRLIRLSCSERGLPIVNVTEIKQNTGYEAFLSVDAAPHKIKEMTLALEAATTMGRLFDMDVIQLNGDKISRSDFDAPRRTCLICGQEAFICSRSRTHDTDELFKRTCDIITDYFFRTG